MDKKVWKSLAMVIHLGVSMVSPVVLCVFAGNWLDGRFGFQTTLPLLILGILAGCRNTWILLKEAGGIERKKKP